MVSDRGIRGSEGPAPGDSAVAHESVQAYQHTQISFYKCVFTNTSTPDSGKSDYQLNNELNNPAPIYGPQDTTSGAIGDLQKGIKSDSRTRHDLGNAIERASVGDTDGAMQYLRQASGDLNDAGGKIDSGLSKLGDGGQSNGSRTIQRGMVNEADCSENIQKAEKLLREGDTEGAIKAMSKGIREVAHRQHQTRDGIASLQGDDNGIDWQNFGPMNSGNDNRLGSYNGNGDTSFYPGFNQGDSNFDSQQHVIRSNNGGWNSTQPFTPDNSGSFQPWGSGGDYNGNYGPGSDSQNGPSLSLNLPNPFDLARDLGLPTPPNPSDILNSLPNPFDMLSGNGGGGLPNPFDMFGGGGSNGGGGSGSGGPFDMFGGLPNPMDMFGGGNSNGGGGGSPFDMFGGLPNPTDMFGGGNSNGGGGGSPFDMFGGLPNPTDMFGGGSGGGGGLPNPFSIFGGGNDSDSGSDESWPNPAKGIGDILKNPAKPIENLLKPPKSPKDLVHKILDPIGLFG